MLTCMFLSDVTYLYMDRLLFLYFYSFLSSVFMLKSIKSKKYNLFKSIGLTFVLSRVFFF